MGGKHRLPMKSLCEFFTAAGANRPRHYIQSGNVVFTATVQSVNRIAASVQDSIRNQFHFNTPIVIRSSNELVEIIAHNPFVAMGADESKLHVAFLQDRPSPTLVKKLDGTRSPPDEFELRGRDIYLHCPNGMGRSKLTTQYFDSTLKTVSTIRNVKTLRALEAMIHDLPSM